MSPVATSNASQVKMARKAGFASFIGTAIEWYDFYAYSTAAALVFGQLFFPSEDPTTGTLASFAAFWVGFLARPLGGVVFGHLGDKIGRKKTLIITLMIMGICTTAIGLLPTYQQIGIAAPILLVTLRIIQGFAVGGEWGGAVALAAEHAPKGKDLIYSAFAQQGSPAGNLLSTAVFFVFSYLAPEAFLDWGWRVPFLLSALLIIVGLWVRMGVEESPTIKQMQAQNTVLEVPITQLLRHHRKMLMLGVGACVIGVSAMYFKSTFALSWAVNEMHISRSQFLGFLTIGIVVQLFFQPLGALIASRIDLKKAIIWILTPEIVLLPLMFLAIASKQSGLIIACICLATLPHSMYYSFLGGILVRAFPPQVRYTGISLCYQLCGMIFGGSTPLLAQFLLNKSGSIIAVIALAIVHILLSMGCAVAVVTRYERQQRLRTHTV
ncbi:MFS transporter [Brackiella oedipodis]|uniref:MFS transporter n=1 Tax=Brackiella oedipodis TaxID=124225 RepID=UPI0004901F31|nr:MFS transporter [Brackiella oedipodis]